VSASIRSSLTTVFIAEIESGKQVSSKPADVSTKSRYDGDRKDVDDSIQALLNPDNQVGRFEDELTKLLNKADQGGKRGE
jgi:hypothetical protein